MTEETSKKGSEGWGLFWGRHRKAVLAFGTGAAALAVWAVLVFLWYVGQAQSNGTVPSTIGLWTMSALVSFLLNLAFWEIALVGIPLIIGFAVAFKWWKSLPYEERMEYRFLRKRSKARNGGGGFSFVVFVVFCIKVNMDGNWNMPFGTWSVDYLVSSYLTAIVWILAVIAIPAIIVLIWWIGYGSKRKGW